MAVLGEGLPHFPFAGAAAGVFVTLQETLSEGLGQRGSGTALDLEQEQVDC
jgi:hypothetical protein